MASKAQKTKICLEKCYSISSRLLENIKAIALITQRLNNRRFSSPILVQMEREAVTQSAFSSTSIEGNPLPLTEVKRIIKNHPKQARNSEREVLNYNDVLLELNKQISKNRVRFDLKQILSVHKGVTKGLLPQFHSGKVRSEPVFVNDPKQKKTIYWPPDHTDVPTLLNDLITFVVTSQGKLDPLIIAGVFHKQFVIIHPFIDGNGRTVRLLTKLLLAHLGLNTFNLFSFENYYNRNVTEYFSQVGVKGDYYDLPDFLKKTDFTQWLEYFTDGIIDELLRVEKILEQEIGSVSLEAPVKTPASTLTEDQQAILKWIKKEGFITDRAYAQLTKRAKPSRNLDFRKLIKLSLIEKMGAGKATYYILKKSGS